MTKRSAGDKSIRVGHIARDAASTGTDSTEPMETAAVLLTLAMWDAQTPVDDLSGALERMTRGLRSVESRRNSKRAASSAELIAELETFRELAAREVSVCIQSVQFHDRLMQQLEAVRNLLAGLANHPLPGVPMQSAQDWDELLEALRNRLTSEPLRQLLDLLLQRGTIDCRIKGSMQGPDGTVELF